MANDDQTGGAQDRITTFWSMVGPDYEAHPGNLPEGADYARWADFLTTLLPEAPADVLDVGTGTGFLALLAAGAGHRVRGIDLAEGMLDVARARAKEQDVDATFSLGDAVAPPFASSSFDVLMSRHVLWTLREPRTAFRNWHQLLRPGGVVIAFDGQWFSETGEEENEVFGAYYTAGTRAELPLMVLSEREPVAELFREAGFRDVTVADLPGELRTATPAGADPPFVLRGRR